MLYSLMTRLSLTLLRESTALGSLVILLPHFVSFLVLLLNSVNKKKKSQSSLTADKMWMPKI